MNLLISSFNHYLCNLGNYFFFIEYKIDSNCFFKESKPKPNSCHSANCLKLSTFDAGTIASTLHNGHITVDISVISIIESSVIISFCKQ